MKKLASVLALTASVGFFASAHAAQNCIAKSAAIEKEIRVAEQFGNSYKVASLKRALAEVKAQCTNESINAGSQKNVQNLEKKLEKNRLEIIQIKANLQDAQKKGDLKKIEKFKRQLIQKQADMREIQKELNRARG
ncbi:DUF1090 family protein [Enterobacter hormaechei]|uniref:DUF1090 family protein n=1 Tax=Enterobacter hormaechei TaxID=158836 RepID=UPI0033145FB0